MTDKAILRKIWRTHVNTMISALAGFRSGGPPTWEEIQMMNDALRNLEEAELEDPEETTE